eukprot:PhM_4_TR7478/c0_g1_i1/m.568
MLMSLLADHTDVILNVVKVTLVPVIIAWFGLMLSFATIRLMKDLLLPLLAFLLGGTALYFLQFVPAVNLAPLPVACVLGAVVTFAATLSGNWLRTLAIGFFGAALTTTGVGFALLYALQEVGYYPASNNNEQLVFYTTLVLVFLTTFATSWSTQWEHWEYFIEETFGSCIRCTPEEFEREGQATTVRELEKLRQAVLSNPNLLGNLQNKDRMAMFLNNPRDFGL